MGVKAMLPNLTVGKILQCVRVSNHHIVYLKLVTCQLHFNKAEKKRRVWFLIPPKRGVL